MLVDGAHFVQGGHARGRGQSRASKVRRQVDAGMTFGLDCAEEFGVTSIRRVGERQSVRSSCGVERDGKPSGLITYLVGIWSRYDRLGRSGCSIGKQFEIRSFVDLTLHHERFSMARPTVWCSTRTLMTSSTGELIVTVMRGAGCQHDKLHPLTIQSITTRVNVLGRTDYGKLLRCLAEHFDDLDCAVEHLSKRSSPSELVSTRLGSSTYKPSVNLIMSMTGWK